MKIYIILTIALVTFLHEAHTEGIFYNKYSGFNVNNGHNPYKGPLNVQSGLMCLAQCNRESNCLTVHFNEETNKCSLYNSLIDTNNLVSQPSSEVFIVKSN
jgi:hypothetical protein